MSYELADSPDLTPEEHAEFTRKETGRGSKAGVSPGSLLTAYPAGIGHDPDPPRKRQPEGDDLPGSERYLYESL